MATCQVMNPSIHSLGECPDQIFVCIGAFLTLDEKIAGFLTLSTSVNRTFKRCLNQFHDSIQIVHPPNLTDPRQFPMLNGHHISQRFHNKMESWKYRGQYGQYARSICARFNEMLDHQTFSMIASHLETALVHGNSLTTLDIEEMSLDSTALSLIVLNCLHGGNIPISLLAEKSWLDAEHERPPSPVQDSHILGNQTLFQLSNQSNHQPTNQSIDEFSWKRITIHSPDVPSCDAFFRLQHLRLRCWHRSNKESNEQFPSQFRGDGLKKCVNLKSLILDVPPESLDQSDPNASTRFLSYLPSSLTTLSVNFNICQSAWQDAFGSPDFLPYLTNLQIGHVHLSDCLTLPSNQAAGPAMRPLRSLTLAAQTHDLISFKSLTHLCIQMVSSQLEQFAHFDHDDMLPYLSSLELSFEEQHSLRYDLTELLCFLAKRPVTKFSVVSVYQGLIPLGERAVRAISKMHSLVALSICAFGGGPFLAPIDRSTKPANPQADVDSWEDRVDDQVCFSDWLPSGCLRQLRSLQITGVSCDIEALLGILPAAPGLNDLDLGESPVGIGILPLAATHCAFVQRLKIKDMRGTSIDEIIQIFEQYPIDQDSFQHLFVLECQALLTPAALHFLCFQLRHAPRLAYLQDWDEMSKFDTCCKFHLKHLRSLPHFQDLQQRQRMLLDIGNDHQFVEPCCTAPSPSPFDVDTTKQSNKPAKFTLTEEVMERDLFGPNREYYRFRQDDSVDGRCLFFSALFDELPGSDQQCLDNWDRIASEIAAEPFKQNHTRR